MWVGDLKKWAGERKKICIRMRDADVRCHYLSLRWKLAIGGTMAGWGSAQPGNCTG